MAWFTSRASGDQEFVVPRRDLVAEERPAATSGLEALRRSARLGRVPQSIDLSARIGPGVYGGGVSMWQWDEGSAKGHSITSIKRE